MSTKYNSKMLREPEIGLPCIIHIHIQRTLMLPEFEFKFHTHNRHQFILMWWCRQFNFDGSINIYRPIPKEWTQKFIQTPNCISIESKFHIDRSKVLLKMYKFLLYLRKWGLKSGCINSKIVSDLSAIGSCFSGYIQLHTDMIFLFFSTFPNILPHFAKKWFFSGNSIFWHHFRTTECIIKSNRLFQQKIIVNLIYVKSRIGQILFQDSNSLEDSYFTFTFLGIIKIKWSAQRNYCFEKSQISFRTFQSFHDVSLYTCIPFTEWSNIYII